MKIIKIINITLLILNVVTRCYAASYLWLWFVVPVFALPALGALQFYALNLLASVLVLPFTLTKANLTRAISEDADRDKEELQKNNFIYNFVFVFLNLTTWGVGWIVQNFFL